MQRAAVHCSVNFSSVSTGDASPGGHNIRDSAEIVPGGRVCVTRDRSGGREGHWKHGG